MPKISDLPPVDELLGTEQVPVVSADTDLATKRTTAQDIANLAPKQAYTVEVTWTAGVIGSDFGAALQVPADDLVASCPVAGEIVAATLLGQGGPGSCEVDIWRSTYANYPPEVADSIVASAPLTIAADIKSRDTTLTGWDASAAAGDVLVFNLVSVNGFSSLTVVLEIAPA